MEFHWPTAGITAAVMVVLLCVVYFIAVYLRGGQFAYFPLLTEAVVCVGLLCGAYNTGGMTEEQAKKEEKEFLDYNRIYSQAAGIDDAAARQAFIRHHFNENLPNFRPSEIDEDEW